MANPQKHRDLSELSALLASHTVPASAKPKARVIAPANDNKPAPSVLAWPAFERLAYRGDYARLFALRHWKNMCFPGSEVVASEEDGLATATKSEMRPTEGELLTAAGWTIIGREPWHWTGKEENVYEACEVAGTRRKSKNGGEDSQLGDLLFRDGRLIEWGRTSKGAALRPVERPRGSKVGPLRLGMMLQSGRT
ncbi:hypothetical protein [Ensifer sp. 1H6]|uniref:hypothetical protein n=1 Tax=Ensifer sp. 1H6 TaxID=1911585 RepID=UPI001FDA907F|nr:hypothetical protein [Ensifer sp. 1H6]